MREPLTARLDVAGELIGDIVERGIVDLNGLRVGAERSAAEEDLIAAVHVGQRDVTR